MRLSSEFPAVAAIDGALAVGVWDQAIDAGEALLATIARAGDVARTRVPTIDERIVAGPVDAQAGGLAQRGAVLAPEQERAVESFRRGLRVVSRATDSRGNDEMPRISLFYGISIWMYYDESQHQGRPHFHARYGDDEASIGIGTGAVIAGGLPPRALRMVHEWSSAHEAELLDNWELARRHRPLRAVGPLR
jgi:hypothetical protein